MSYVIYINRLICLIRISNNRLNTRVNYAVWVEDAWALKNVILNIKNSARTHLCVGSYRDANGGSGGIRTPVGLHPNGFQDRLVVTASIHFRILKCNSSGKQDKALNSIHIGIEASLRSFALSLRNLRPILGRNTLPYIQLLIYYNNLPLLCQFVSQLFD